MTRIRVIAVLCAIALSLFALAGCAAQRDATRKQPVSQIAPQEIHTPQEQPAPQFTPVSLDRYFAQQEKPECDIAKAIKEEVATLLQTPITYEEAVQILDGNSPGGGLLSFNIATDPSWFLPLEKTFFSGSLDSDKGSLKYVIRIWYKRNPTTHQYFTVFQCSAIDHLRQFPDHINGISLSRHSHFTWQLMDGARVELMFLNTTEDGIPYPEGRYVWLVEWISNDVHHYLHGVNISADDLYWIVTNLSYQSVIKQPFP